MKRNKILFGALGIALIALVSYALLRKDFIHHSTNTSSADGQHELSDKPPGTLVSNRPDSTSKAVESSGLSKKLKSAQLGSLPALSAPLAAKIPELESLANNGDAAAALNLWYGLNQCESVISESESNFLKNGNPATVKMFAKQTSDLLDNCKDVTAEQMSKQYKWLKLAAQLGNAQAQYFYSLAGTDALGGVDEALRHPAEWQEYRDTAESYLESLSHQCSPDAIGSLAYAYQKGDRIFSMDLQKSYEYQLLSLRLNPATTPEIESTVLAYYKNKLSSENIASASRQASDFFQNYCN